MNRRTFFKMAVAGLAAVALTPQKVVARMIAPPVPPPTVHVQAPLTFHGAPIIFDNQTVIGVAIENIDEERYGRVRLVPFKGYKI